MDFNFTSRLVTSRGKILLAEKFDIVSLCIGLVSIQEVNIRVFVLKAEKALNL